MFCVSPLLAQTNFIMPLKIINSDGSTSERATFGIDSVATNSLDDAFGEFEIPALFPTILSAAFVFYDPTLQEEIMSYKDIRPDFQSEQDSIVYHLSISGIINSFTVKWSQFPAGVKKAIMKSTYLSDKYNWINMFTQDSVNVTNTAVTDFTITVYNYDDGVGVEEVKKDDFDEMLSVRNGRVLFPAGTVTSAEVYSVQGTRLMQLDRPNEIDLSDMPLGVYPVMLNTVYGKKTYTIHNSVSSK